VRHRTASRPDRRSRRRGPRALIGRPSAPPALRCP